VTVGDSWWHWVQPLICALCMVVNIPPF